MRYGGWRRQYWCGLNIQLSLLANLYVELVEAYYSFVVCRENIREHIESVNKLVSRNGFRKATAHGAVL